MKTMFPLALLCLLLSSCSKDAFILSENVQTENRTSANIYVTYPLPNGGESTVECLKVESSAVNSSTLNAKIFISPTSFYSVSLSSLTISGINGLVKCTNAKGEVYDNLTTAKMVASSSSEINLVLGSNNVVTSSSFIGEDRDGI